MIFLPKTVGFSLGLSSLGLTLALCGSNALAAPKMMASIASKPFGTLPGGEETLLFTLKNTRGATATISNYGGTLTSLMVPDKRGQFADVVLGYPTLAGYLNDGKNYGTYQGALIGRYGNRIAKGKFTLDGKAYPLAINNGPNSLHGGKVGFDKVVWQARPLKLNDGVALELKYLSKAGEEGYPGNLNTRVLYILDNQNRLRIEYTATTDAPTVVNLTEHAYFNLAGIGTGTILGHKLQINANSFTPIDTTSIPLGQLQPVKGTPFDFRTLHTIGSRIGAKNAQLKNGAGYDHNFVLNHPMGKVGYAARVVEPKSGRVMRLYTSEPGVQLYTGNFLSGQTGKNGTKEVRRGGFCLETQHFPDSPNQKQFPTTTLRPGQTYRQTTIYAFSLR